MNESPRPQPSYIKHLLMIAGGLLLVLLILVIKGQLQPARKTLAQSVPETPPTETSPTAEECLSTIDPSTGEQTDARCPAPESEQASETGEIAEAHKLDSNCPPPLVPQDHQCVIENDITIDKTLDLGSFTKLNCQGNTISPTKPMDTGLSTAHSSPEVAIILHDAYGVKLQNCIIDKFDNGVVVVNSKVTAEQKSDPETLAMLRNNILENTINARYRGVLLEKVDNTDIKNNTITLTSAGSLGITVYHGSNFNRIIDNSVTHNVAALNPLVSIGTNVTVNKGVAGISIIHRFNTKGGPRIPPLDNMIIGNTLYQFPFDPNEIPEDNLIEGNTVSVNPAPGVQFTSNVVTLGAFGTLRTTIRNNTISGGFGGIEMQGGNFPSQGPNRCTLDPSRFCVTNSDCYIPGFDTASKGTCPLPLPVFGPTTVKDTLVEGNVVNGGAGLLVFLADNTILRNNTVTGASAGLTINNVGLESTTAMHNVFSGNTNGLLLNRNTARGLNPGTHISFGSNISLNDFTGYTNAVQTDNDNYPLSAELSVADQGNYWGLTCAQGGFDPSKVRQLNGAVNPYVKDSHPYGVPVAAIQGSSAEGDFNNTNSDTGTSDSELPATCR